MDCKLCDGKVKFFEIIQKRYDIGPDGVVDFVSGKETDACLSHLSEAECVECHTQYEIEVGKLGVVVTSNVEGA